MKNIFKGALLLAITVSSIILSADRAFAVTAPCAAANRNPFTGYEGCADAVWVKDANGQNVDPPYRKQYYWKCRSDTMTCQRSYYITDDYDVSPGNKAFGINEGYTVIRQIVNNYGPGYYVGEAYENMNNEDFMHPVFLREIANDPAIKNGKREYAGREDPVFYPHEQCDHEWGELHTETYTWTDDDGTEHTETYTYRSYPTTNFEADETQGEYIESTANIDNILADIAVKIKLKMVE